MPAARLPALVVHGGAGADPGEGPAELREGMRAAVRAGSTPLMPVAWMGPALTEPALGF